MFDWKTLFRCLEGGSHGMTGARAFKRCIAKTGQVIIQVRDVSGFGWSGAG